jgi:hypothetical protein
MSKKNNDPTSEWVSLCKQLEEAKATFEATEVYAACEEGLIIEKKRGLKDSIAAA